MKLSYRLFFIACLIFASQLAFSGNKKVHYLPKVVQLEGVIEVHTFPGPPNYESIKKGDAPEKGYYLRLKNPIDVAIDPNTNNELDEPEKNVTLVQLALGNTTGSEKLKPGKHVVLEGRLFHAHTGHHHTAVLMEVIRVK